MKYCLNCFQKIDDDADVCPYCHYRQSAPARKQQYLKPGIVFEDRYIIGTALGSGGFSVTYKAFDASLNKVVAIKEYLPVDVCTRSLDSEDVIVFSDEEKEDAFDAGKRKFEQEAKRMARFQGVPHIVQVYDTIEANNTCYIIMEYLDGETVASFVKRYGQIDEAKALRITIPVLEALEVIHSKHMLHRDISPSNIMLLRDGDVKLLDFGSARYTNSDYSRSLTVLYKEGYTPEEQYYTNGHQGPWSDVYSVAATLYYMLTGVRIESALDRKANDTIVFPSLYANVHRNVETAIMNGLSVDYRMRTQSAKEMKNELCSETNVVMHYTRSSSKSGALIPKPLKYVAGIAFVCLLVFVVALSNGAFISFDEDYLELNDDASQVPSLIGLSQSQAKTLLKKRSITPNIQLVNDPTTKADTVISQSVNAGTVLKGKKKMTMKVATGATNVYLPNYTGMNSNSYLAGLKKNHFSKIVIKQKKSDIYAPDSILKLEGEDATGQSVSVHANKTFSTANKLIVHVAKARKIAKAGSDTTVPSLVHAKLSEIHAKVKKAGLLVRVRGYERNDYPVGTIIRVSAPKGTAKQRGDVIDLTLSAGKLNVQVPKVLGLDQADAVAKLKAANMPADHILIQKQDSTNYGKGTIISQNGTEGQLMSESSYIKLIVSNGFMMNNVVGDYADNGVSILRHQGLNVVRHYIYENGIVSDTIIRTDPVGGTYVSSGDTVNVYIQKDSNEINESDYIGEDPEDVYNTLYYQKGFTNITYGIKYSDTIEVGKVSSISPNGEVKLDTPITIYVSAGSEASNYEDESDDTSTDTNTTDETTDNTTDSASIGGTKLFVNEYSK